MTTLEELLKEFDADIGEYEACDEWDYSELRNIKECAFYKPIREFIIKAFTAGVEAGKKELDGEISYWVGTNWFSHDDDDHISPTKEIRVVDVDDLLKKLDSLSTNKEEEKKIGYMGTSGTEMSDHDY
jgi:hypothetical protein